MRIAFVWWSTLFFALATSFVEARVLENWPYSRLFEKADIVVVASALSTKGAPDKLVDKRWPLELVGQDTTFRVSHVLKGQADLKKITVLHFAFEGMVSKESEVSVSQTQIIDGPLFVRFRTKSNRVREVRLPTPEYMLFLRKRPDGRFEPVSGPIDPQLSVREVFHPLPAELGGSAAPD